MGTIIGVVNIKGGVGKSTISAHLAAWLHDRGESVAFIDTDGQGSSSVWLSQAEPKIQTERIHDYKELTRHAKAAASSYKFVICDGPATLGETTRGILLVSDLALLPCVPSSLDWGSLGQTIAELENCRMLREGKPEALIVCNKMDERANLSREFLEFAQANFQVPLAKGLIHLWQVYAEAARRLTFVGRMGREGERAAKEMESLFMGICYGEEAAA
jgi:chromosome partitioning protein